jgi:hypothetical protein
MAQTFFYDRQIRRFILQFIRIMSNFEVETGLNSAGNSALIRVPVVYGDPTRQAAQILGNNSETSLPPVPIMAAIVNELKYDRARVQEPNFVSTMTIRQRKVDPESGQLQTVRGNSFTVERLMPVPYKLTIKLDIWTSNTEQKLQILEQILALYNPALEIQNTDNYVDWSSLSYVELTDTTWSSRSIPVNTENPIDIATLTFEIPIWISAPAKVKKLGIIERIIASIYDSQDELDSAITAGKLLNGQRQYVTPLKFSIILLSGRVQIYSVPNSTIITDSVSTTTVGNGGGELQNWAAVINVFGQLRNGLSELHLSHADSRPDIVGVISENPLDPKELLFTVDGDTIPVNTLFPIDAIINPEKSFPGGKLGVPVAGQRYLLLDSINGAAAWGTSFYARGNDIIEYDGSNWTVSFDSAASAGPDYVTNINTGIQYKWSSGTWVKSYDGEYPAGRWHLVL